MICSFFGHREIEETRELIEATRAEVLRVINAGCRTFYFGGYGEFALLCYQIVTRLKEERADLGIERIYCVPQERYLRKKSRYFEPEEYEDIIYLTPSFEGRYKSIHFQNYAMIDMSDKIIFYAEKRADSSAYKAFKYAKRKKDKSIVNLWGV